MFLHPPPIHRIRRHLRLTRFHTSDYSISPEFIPHIPYPHRPTPISQPHDHTLNRQSACVHMLSSILHRHSACVHMLLHILLGFSACTHAPPMIFRCFRMCPHASWYS